MEPWGQYGRRLLGRAFLEERVRRGNLRGVHAWGRLVEQRAELKAPVKAGRLARSIHTGDAYEPEAFVAQVEVGTNVEYARAQEEGSGIHALDPSRRELILIEARRKKSLAFAWPDGPQGLVDPATGLAFFRRVYHPGVRPQPYLRPALFSTKDEGPSLVMRAIVAELRR